MNTVNIEKKLDRLIWILEQIEKKLPQPTTISYAFGCEHIWQYIYASAGSQRQCTKCYTTEQLPEQNYTITNTTEA